MIESIARSGVESNAEFLDCCDDYLVSIIRAFKPANQSCRVNILLYATFLELVKLVTSLLVEVLAVHDKNALLYVGSNFSRVEVLKLVRVLPLPVVCQI